MSDFIVKDGLVANGSIKGNTGTVTGNATLDLSTGDAFEVTPTADVTFAFSNPPAAGNAQAFSVALTGVEVGTPYDLANASYVSEYDPIEELYNCGLFFKPDGITMYIVGQIGDIRDKVTEYNLSTAWDISTAAYVRAFVVASQDNAPWGLFFKPDGTKMYISGKQNDKVYEYNLSTAWDISTASYLQDFSVATEDTSPGDIFFKPDGTAMYFAGLSGADINEYSLSTAWDISTASYVQNFSVSEHETFPRTVFFRPTGDKMYVAGSSGNDVNEYSLSIAWDISTASYAQTFGDANISGLVGLFFKEDGASLYISSLNNGKIFQYTTGTAPAAATITYPASVQWSGGTAPTAPATGETDLLTFYTEDGGTTYYGFKVGDALA